MIYDDKKLNEMIDSLTHEQQVELGFARPRVDRFDITYKSKKSITKINALKKQLISLGEDALIAWDSRYFRGIDAVAEKHEGCLIFWVYDVKNISKGRIEISIVCDLYNIEIFDETIKMNPSIEPVHSFKGVYAFDLIKTIGDAIGY